MGGGARKAFRGPNFEGPIKAAILMLILICAVTTTYLSFHSEPKHLFIKMTKE